MTTTAPFRRSLPLFEPRVRHAADTAEDVELDIDHDGLASELAQYVKGEVRFDRGSRGLYATDASNYRQIPIGVVLPRDADDIVATVDLCARYGAPILSRGGGTSLAGQGCNAAVVMDMSKYYNRVLELDADGHAALVEPGIVLDELRNAAERHHLTFGPDPATHSRCTLGGMLGNNSCGVHSQMAGRTVDNVIALEVLTYDGTRMWVGQTSDAEYDEIDRAGGQRAEIYRKLRQLRDTYGHLIRERYPDIPRRVSGYNLDELLPERGFHVARSLVGSESTCVTILHARLRLVDSPRARILLVLGYPDIFHAADDVLEIAATSPLGLEGIDDRLIAYMRQEGLHAQDLKVLPAGRGWLVAEYGGETIEEAETTATKVMDHLKKRSQPPTMGLFTRQEIESRIWDIREASLGATARIPAGPDTWGGWEDSAVAPAQLGSYLRKLRGLMDRYNFDCSLYGHFGQGCVHCRIPFDLLTRKGIDAYRSFTREAAELVVAHGGSLSGEHGDGQSRAELLPIMFGPELVKAFAEFKSIWDPAGKMNPHKIVDAYKQDENLRLGTHYNPPVPSTHFSYSADNGSFPRAVLRCVGVGLCRRHDHGVMCPSYMVTREEMHSTRGRARLLFEMLQGEVLNEGFRSPHVREALDLCLACKGCKTDCPVNVDMATYKAEFLSHYYARRLRPRSAYALGLIDVWARLASKAPGFANFIMRAPGLGSLFKWAGGVAPQRSIPQFAKQTFRSQFVAPDPPQRGQRVLLWADTFNNHFHPEVLHAAAEVLIYAGYEVEVPGKHLCCGRALYDFGFLDRAKRLLADVLTTLAPDIERGTPVVVLEPSCAAVFRDELINLYPNDHNAKRLAAQTFTLADFLLKGPRGTPDLRLERKALVHGHCHHKTVLGFDGEPELLRKLGVDCNVLDSGCCGMAGSFGYEREHYDISLQIGERVLLPAVRAAAEQELIVADGFSCRGQIEQTTPRRALHLAEVLLMALREEPSGPRKALPERALPGQS